MDNKKSLPERILELVIFFAIIVISLIIIDKTINIFSDKKGNQFQNTKEEQNLTEDKKEDKKENIVDVIKKIELEPSKFPDYNYYQKLKKINLVSSVESWADKNQNVYGRIYKKFEVSGKISNAYLFIDASVDKGSPLTIWDSIYITLRKVDYYPKGAHILRNKSLKIPSNHTTKLLYDLKQIPYISTIPYSEEKSAKFCDWLTLLNDGDTLQLETFISTLRKGTFNDISIGYECLEDSPNCSLSFVE